MELITKLGIDWKLLIAQIINFAILLFVLGRFVYRPVLEMLERRSKIIEKGVRDAKESEEQLQLAENLKKDRIAEAQRTVGQIMEKAKQDGDKISAQILATAHAQAEDLLRRARIQLEEEKLAMMEALRKHVTELIITATGKILQREFSAGDQKRLSEALLKEMTSVR